MSYRLELKIDGLPKTFNSIGRRHWAIKAREAKIWRKLVYLHVGNKRPPSPLKQAKLTLVRASSVCPDPDGLVQSFKHCLDGLIDAGVLEDDKITNIGMPDFKWEPAPRGKGFVKITVETRPVG